MIDLNLVRAFVAIYETKSVSAAAQRLNITQPSVSYALQRLRDLLQDPLFTRTRNGMQPTFHAAQLFSTFKASIDSIQDAIASARHFDPSSSHRSFRLALSDLGEAHFLPHLARVFALAAPSVSLEIVQIESDRIGDWLTTGHVDAAIGNLQFVGKDIRIQTLFSEDYCCVVNADHPGIGSTLSLQQYLEASHIEITPGTGHHLIEDLLSAMGVRRRIALRVPHFTSLVAVVAATDLVLTLPRRIAASFVMQGALRIVPLPFPAPQFDVCIYWHPHSEDAVAQHWFCETVAHTLSTV